MLPTVWKFVFKGNYMGSRLRFFLGLFTILFYFFSFLLSFSKLSNENKSLAISIFQNYIKGPALKCTAAQDWHFSMPGGRHEAKIQPWILWVLVAVGFAGDCGLSMPGDISHYCSSSPPPPQPKLSGITKLQIQTHNNRLRSIWHCKHRGFSWLISKVVPAFPSPC